MVSQCCEFIHEVLTEFELRCKRQIPYARAIFKRRAYKCMLCTAVLKMVLTSNKHFLMMNNFLTATIRIASICLWQVRSLLTFMSRSVTIDLQ